MSSKLPKTRWVDKKKSHIATRSAKHTAENNTRKHERREFQNMCNMVLYWCCVCLFMFPQTGKCMVALTPHGHTGRKTEWRKSAKCGGWVGVAVHKGMLSGCVFPHVLPTAIAKRRSCFSAALAARRAKIIPVCPRQGRFFFLFDRDVREGFGTGWSTRKLFRQAGRRSHVFFSVAIAKHCSCFFCRVGCPQGKDHVRVPPGKADFFIEATERGVGGRAENPE